MKKNILKKLKNKIIVSCQPNEGGPQDKTSIIVSMAKAAILGGCGGVRIEGEKNIRAVKKNISVKHSNRGGSGIQSSKLIEFV